MPSHKTFARRMLVTAVGSGALLLGMSIPANADPPNCTAADLSGVMTGVMAATTTYLYTHPPVNDYFTTLKNMSAEDKKAAVIAFMDANPQVKAELTGIRQPAVDFRARCG